LNTAIAAGYLHTCALTSSDGVMCWGSNNDGQLGNGTAGEAAVSGAVDVSGLASGVVAIAAGEFHTCALTTSGGVKCWGANSYGQLGDGSTSNSSVPVDVSGLASGVAAIAAGSDHTCALTSGSGVKCWGNNHVGGLGDGTTTWSKVPVDVVGLGSGVSAVAAGGGHTCAIIRSGVVTCWGDGQAADADVFHTSVATDVPGLASGVTAITADNDRTCALMGGREIMCWGLNYAPPPGETLPDRMIAVDVSHLAGGVAAMAMGETGICLLTNRGGVACLGTNSYGQLGSGATTASSYWVSVEVASLGSGVTGIAVGAMHICALTTSGVKCWGANGYGQLGSVMRCSSTSVPVEVPLDGGATAAPPTGVPTWAPAGRIEHATGATDVVLRYDISPDVGVSELAGEQFNPGPEFTLYGDGTVIFQSESAPLAPTERPIVRGRPFMVARLDDDQVQTLLRFALGEGGLANACERYETQDTDVAESHVLSIRVGGLVKRVDVGGPSPLGPLLGRLGNYEPGTGVPTQVWVPDGYWGSLIEAGPAIEIGLLPHPREVGSAPWPWANITVAEFTGRDGGGYLGPPRRVLTADEAGVLGLSADGGVVQRTYLIGPDRKTVYYFSLWPMLPDEAG
jgi:alpha-tubulin suppressor-like RCC1 family protein